MVMKKYLVIFLMLWGISSCTKQDLETELKMGQREFVQFKFSLPTRATDYNFEEGDEIGIYVVKSNGGTGVLQSMGNFADNKRFVVRNGRIVPYSEEDRIMIESGITYDYYAYYPYKNNFSPLNQLFLQSTDQSDIQKYKEGDVKYAIIKNIQGETVYLSFKHAFALLEVHLTKASIYDINGMDVESSYHGGTFNLYNGRLDTYLDSRSGIKMNLYSVNGNNYIFRALLPAQTYVPGQSICYLFLGNEKHLINHYKNQNVLSLVAGKKAIYELKERFAVYPYTQNESCWVSPEQRDYWCGDYATVIAHPGENYQFVGWYNAPNYLDIVSTNPVYRFVVDRPYTLKAMFEKKGK